MFRTLAEAVMVVALGVAAYNEWGRLFAFNGEHKIKERLRDAETELKVSRTKLEEAGLVHRMQG